MTIMTLYILKRKSVYSWCSVIHRQRILAADILCLPIRITEIEAVDNKRCHDIVHLDILKCYIIKHRILATASSCLNPEASVRI